MKKSQGLSINVIIIVAIALIVLVVLIAVFTGRLGNFVTGVGDVTENCEQRCESIGLSDTGSAPSAGSCGAGQTKIGNCCCEEEVVERTPTRP